MQISKWLKTVADVCSNKSGVCPFCGGDDIDSDFQIVLNDERIGYGAIWCDACKRGVYMDRAEVPLDANIKPIPTDISYK